jgi:hypothetical protein
MRSPFLCAYAVNSLHLVKAEKQGCTTCVILACLSPAYSTKLLPLGLAQLFDFRIYCGYNLGY